MALFTNSIEWLTVPCDWTAGSWLTRLYAAHSSDQTVVPGCRWACMIGRSVAASLLSTISMYPKAGVWDTSHMPNTQTGSSAGRPLLYCYWNVFAVIVFSTYLWLMGKKEIRQC